MRHTHPDPALERQLTELEAQGVGPAILARFASQSMACEIAWVLFGSAGPNSADDLDELHAVSLLAGSLEASFRARAAENEQLSFEDDSLNLASAIIRETTSSPKRYREAVPGRD